MLLHPVSVIEGGHVAASCFCNILFIIKRIVHNKSLALYKFPIVLLLRFILLIILVLLL